MDKKKNEKSHLPVYGIGPVLCIPLLLVFVMLIVLNAMGKIPTTDFGTTVNRILLILGILVIAEGLIIFFGADAGGNLADSIKENRLKTNGSYKFVRNPCYALFLLVETGGSLISHNLYLLIIPLLFWIEMTIVLKNTEEKWLTELYGQEYLDYCKRVNRCIPWFFKK